MLEGIGNDDGGTRIIQSSFTLIPKVHLRRNMELGGNKKGILLVVWEE